MAKENEQELNLDEELEEPEEILDESGQDTTDWKAEALKNFGRLKRITTDLKEYKKKEKETKEAEEKAKPEAEKKPSESQDKKDFDLAEKSYLLANGIKKDQIPLVWEECQKSGKSIDEILESPYFKEKLELAASEEATPTGSKRAGGTAVNSVEYWVKKGQYPPNTPENTELRRKVAKALETGTEDSQKFSPRPIV